MFLVITVVDACHVVVHNSYKVCNMVVVAAAADKIVVEDDSDGEIVVGGLIAAVVDKVVDNFVDKVVVCRNYPV